MKTFYSNGKLLLTAEYLILDGAKALAVPTIFGQTLAISETTNNDIHWISYDSDESIWYEAHFLKNDIINKKDDFDNPITNTLINILYFANCQNSEILDHFSGFNVETKLNFPRNWGLGTSSTLINNIAQWFAVDAFELLQKAFGGSGYDIACAQNNMPIIYQLQNEKPIVETVLFNPIFKKHLYFVYLNQKQSSKTAIANYLNNKADVANITENINNFTNIISTTTDLQIFCSTLKMHESELSQILKTPTIQEQLFADFDGVVKSLGAWGGDFVMVVATADPTDYFQQKGFHVIFKYDEMILKQ